MRILHTILSIIGNKYFIATIVFIVLMLFYDKNDLFMQAHRQQQLQELSVSRSFYEREIEKLRKQLTELEANPENLQRYARENLFMKKENEDIFIIEPADDVKDSSSSK